MKNYVIISDTTCDLSNEVLAKYDIKLINAHYKDIDGSDMTSFSDWKNTNKYTSTEFYKSLKSNPDKYSTSCASVTEIYNEFIKYVSDGYDILALTISSAMSGTYNFYCKAKEMVSEKYPESKILVLDTLRFGSGIGLMEIKASILRSEGSSIDDTYNYLESNKSCFHQMGWLDDLSFVAKKGRITHAKAFFGKLIGIKPLGEADSNGLTTVIGKAKGEQNGYKAIISYIKETIIEDDSPILICHSMREKNAIEFIEIIKKEFSNKLVYMNESGPSNGINMGPGLLAAYYVGKKSSENLTKEKEIMENILLNL